MSLVPAIKSFLTGGGSPGISSSDITAMIAAEEARQRELTGQIGGLGAEERAAALKDNAAFDAVVERRSALERAQRQCELRLVALGDELKAAQEAEARAEVDAALADAREAQSESLKLIADYQNQAQAMAKTLRAMQAATARITNANSKASAAGRRAEEIEYGAPLAGWTWSGRGQVRCVSGLVDLPSPYGSYFNSANPNGIEHR